MEDIKLFQNKTYATEVTEVAGRYRIFISCRSTRGCSIPGEAVRLEKKRYRSRKGALQAAKRFHEKTK